MTAWIDVRLAIAMSSGIKKFISKSCSFQGSHLCRSRQPLTTAIQCTVGNAQDFDTLDRWWIQLVISNLLLSIKLRYSTGLACS